MRNELRRSFFEKYSFYIPPAHKSFFSSEDLDRFLDARYDFIFKRTGDLKLKIENPASEFFWLINTTVIEALMPDSPFIIDTILDYLKSFDYRINLIVHPIFSLTRNRAGEMTAVDFAEGKEGLESYVYIEINRLDAKTLNDLRKVLTENLMSLRTIVADFSDMLGALDTVRFEKEENKTISRWISDNFIMLGLSNCENGKPVEPFYGEFRQNSRNRYFTGIQIETAARQESVTVYETEIFSRVNRRDRLYLCVFSDGRNSVAFIGQFSRKSALTPRYEIPLVREKLSAIALKMKAPQSSYLRKELFVAAQVFPAGILFTRSSGLIEEWFTKILSCTYSSDVDYGFYLDKDYDLCWVLAVIPLRDAQSIPGSVFFEFLAEKNLTVTHTVRSGLGRNEIFLVSLRSSEGAEKTRALFEERGDSLFESWSSRFRKLVMDKVVGESQTAKALDRYFKGMSSAYQISQTPSEALADLMRLESLPQDRICADYYERSPEEDCLKIYSSNAVHLSDIVPIISNFGFVVRNEISLPYESDGLRRFAISFSVDPHPSYSRADRVRISQALEAVINREIISEPLDSLVLLGGLSARELHLIKALSGYFFQILKSYGRLMHQRTLTSYPEYVRTLIEYFQARLGAASDEEAARMKIESELQKCRTSLDESILRMYARIVGAIVRTNYFQNHPEIAFKIKTPELLSPPCPLVEIYIYAYDLEGVHLRGGMIARGGIRWSDRPDDFRTEIFDLMRAQMVKNTIIVPEGSKGGFVLKNRVFRDRNEWLEAGKAAYKRFISTLLDLTDTLHGEKIIPASGIRRLDNDDSYLVVAADKGTASFSDTANEISISKKFWLGDAFASGGSNGYDHKKQGITAKGAWESVRRHFRELGMNADSDALRIVGIGDMSGDVFGNGLLLSQNALLLGAFNGQFVFLDPEPDAKKSYEERKRLFAGGGNWNEYNLQLISRGGGVFDRSSRRIELSESVRKAFDIKEKQLSGEELIRSMLRAPVDLIWNGGIGTYIKAARETHIAVGDSANDRVRVDAKDIRARVIAEGGNLGLTQPARIEAFEAGVKLNTDAVDNSAGVDMSDHEVNLKILLDQLVRKKKILRQKRNSIIRELEKDEIQKVLSHNISNNLAVALDERRVPAHFLYFRSLIRMLNREGIISREADSIPFEADLDRIEKESKKLPGPVLCSLLGFTKLFLKREFLKSGGFHGPVFEEFLLGYFPAKLTEQFGPEARKHPLRREIIITETVNRMVNQSGMAFCQRMHMRTGRSYREIASVYTHVCDFLNISGRMALLSGEGRKDFYDALLFMDECLFAVISSQIIEPVALSEKGKETFREIWGRASAFSRRTEISFTDEHSRIGKGDQRNLEFLKHADVLEDAFQIYRQRIETKSAWSVDDYFSVIEEFHFHELKSLARGLKASSELELLFQSRIDRVMLNLIVLCLEKIRAPSGRSAVHEILSHFLDQIRSVSDQISPAAFYEAVAQAHSGVARIGRSSLK